MDITLGQMIAACGGEWQGSAELLNRIPVSVVTDSRDAGEGSVFTALHGERTDGHKYIPNVLAQGALAVLCEERGADGEPRIVVEDVMAAMRKIAAWNHTRFSIPFIGVTGSVGKTTAKEMIASVLGAKYRTFKTPGSLNGQIGLPVTLMTISAEDEAAVIEMGISLPGEMAKLSELVRPDYAVFTNIGDAHLEALHDRPGILREKAQICSCMSTTGAVFVNGDDELLKAADFDRRKITFGLGEHCDVRAENISQNDRAEMTCTILAGDRRFDAFVPAYGTYMIYSVLAAAAVGTELGMTDAEIAAGLAEYKTVGHRSRVVKTGRCTLIDDCYNANPTSNRAAIDSMMAFEGRKVCILGDMREMGERSEVLHRELGEYIRDKGVDALITYGEQARFISESAGDRAVHFEARSELLAAIPNLIQKGDVVLVKASHGPNFVDIVEAIENL